MFLIHHLDKIYMDHLNVLSQHPFKILHLNDIDRLFQHPVKEDPNYLMANKYANHVVYTGSEKLRNE